MGRFSSVLVLLLAACGDNLEVDPGAPLPLHQVDPDGNATATPRYVPSVCGVQSWTTGLAAIPGMNVSVAARHDVTGVPDGAVVLATPREGGTLTGFVLDTRMDMVSERKLAIDGAFTQVVASYVNDRLVSTAVQDGAVFMHLLDNDLGNPQYTAKLPGTMVADPAFYKTQADIVMPVAGDDGLWLHRFDDSLEPLDSKLVIPTKPARSMTAAQMGVALFTAWSTDSECYMMLTSTFGGGIDTRLPVACHDPRISINQQTSEGVMVFDSPEGVRLMNIYGGQFGGDARVLREGTGAARTVHDGTSFWISYLDTRGDIIVGFLDGKRQLVTMSLAHPRPEAGAYELVMVDGSPWVFSLGVGGYSAYRMCIDAQW
jgi:hypothetical protein